MRSSRCRGGYGTWDELCEVLTWSQIGIQSKASAILNVNGYYDPLLAMADRAVAEGFLRDIHRELLLTDTEPARLLDRSRATTFRWSINGWTGRIGSLVFALRDF